MTREEFDTFDTTGTYDESEFQGVWADDKTDLVRLYAEGGIGIYKEVAQFAATILPLSDADRIQLGRIWWSDRIEEMYEADV